MFDSLLYSSVAGKIQWNGINEIVRGRFQGNVVRLRHETGHVQTRSWKSPGTIAAGLRERNLPLQHFSLDSQFSRKVLDSDDDGVAFSSSRMWRTHWSEDGATVAFCCLIAPRSGARKIGTGCGRTSRRWSTSPSNIHGPFDPGHSENSLTRGVHVLLYNMFP